MAASGHEIEINLGQFAFVGSVLVTSSHASAPRHGNYRVLIHLTESLLS